TVSGTCGRSEASTVKRARHTLDRILLADLYTDIHVLTLGVATEVVTNDHAARHLEQRARLNIVGHLVRKYCCHVTVGHSPSNSGCVANRRLSRRVSRHLYVMRLMSPDMPSLDRR